MSVNIQNIKIELESLKNEDYSLNDTYQKKWQEWQKNSVIEDDVKKEFHDIMDRQLKLTSGTFALVGHAIDEFEHMNVTINNLNDEKVRVEFLKKYRDWIGRFFHKLKAKKLGRDNWRDIKEAINDYRYEKVDVSGRQCVISLNKILSNINMVFEDIVLLIEMKADSNNAFHQEWQKVVEVKEQLKNQQFPAGMEKYKDPLQSLANASDTWVAWR